MCTNANTNAECECAICFECVTTPDTISLNCGHTFCASCIVNTLKINHSYSGPCCALCRTQMKIFNVYKLDHYNSVMTFVKTK